MKREKKAVVSVPTGGAGRLLISNIQRFSLHDGPGIRTTVFLMGCALKCPWCANPENREAKIQRYRKDGREGTFGKYIPAEEVLEECLKDKAFYEPGGVTFSGGEPLLQMDALLPLCEALHGEGIHVAAETSLYTSDTDLEKALTQIDLFLIDVKILDEKKAMAVEGGRLSVYYRNLQRLMQAETQRILRIPLIAGYTDDRENLERIRELICEYRDRIQAIELLEGHDLGKSKYRALGMQPLPDVKVPEERQQQVFAWIKETGVPVKLCTI